MTRTNSSMAASYQASGRRDGSANRLRSPRIAIRRGMRTGSAAISSGHDAHERHELAQLAERDRRAEQHQPAHVVRASSAPPRGRCGRRGCCRRARPGPPQVSRRNCGQPVAEVAGGVRGAAWPRCRRARQVRARARGSRATAPGSAAASRRWSRSGRARAPPAARRPGRPRGRTSRCRRRAPSRVRVRVSSAASPGNRPSICRARARLPRTVRSPSRKAWTPLRAPDTTSAQHRRSGRGRWWSGRRAAAAGLGAALLDLDRPVGHAAGGEQHRRRS